MKKKFIKDNIVREKPAQQVSVILNYFSHIFHRLTTIASMVIFLFLLEHVKFWELGSFIGFFFFLIVLVVW
jgi:hypothetical protein